MFTVTVTDVDLRSKLRELKLELERRAEDAVKQQAAEAAQRITTGAYWTVRTGKTEASFKLVRRGAASWRLSTQSKIALFLEVGTKPHDIRPRDKKALHWVDGGGEHFRRGVHHPGTRARGYEEIEAKRGERELQARVSDLASGAIRAAGL